MTTPPLPRNATQEQVEQQPQSSCKFTDERLTASVELTVIAYSNNRENISVGAQLKQLVSKKNLKLYFNIKI